MWYSSLWQTVGRMVRIALQKFNIKVLFEREELVIVGPFGVRAVWHGSRLWHLTPQIVACLSQGFCI